MISTLYTQLRTLLCIGFLVSVVCAADEPKKPDSPASPSISASGVVLGPDGKPVAGAIVILREDSALRVGEEPWKPFPSDILAITETDRDGAYRFSDVPTRPMRFWDFDQPPVSPPSPWNVVVLNTGKAIAWTWLTSAEGKESVDFRLAPEAALHGRVIDANGKPIMGVVVTVASIGNSRDRDNAGFPIPMLVLMQHRLNLVTKTDEAGKFTMTGLPRDQAIALVFEHDDYALHAAIAAVSDQPQRDAVGIFVDRRVAPRSLTVSTGDLPVTLRPAPRLTGRVKFADTGRAAAGVRILLGEYYRGFQAVSDKDGKFSFRTMPDSEYKLRVLPVDGTAYVGWQTSVKFTDDKLNIDVNIELPRGQIVSGEVIDEETNAGIAGVTVLYATGVADNVIDVPLPQEGTTDVKGRFQLVAPIGNGTVRVAGPVAHYDLPSRYLSETAPRLMGFREEVAVLAKQPASGLRFVVGRGLVVEGVVIDESGAPAVGVDVVRAPGMEGRMKRVVARTDAKGRFLFDGFPVNSEHILIATDARRKTLGSMRISMQNSVRRTEVVEVEMRLRPVGKVKGQIRLRQIPVGAGLVILSFGGKPVKDPDHGLYSIQFASTRTDAAGRFEMGEIEADTPYTLRVMVKDAKELFLNDAIVVESGEDLEIPVIDLEPAPGK
jgi:hypothetical protein